MKRATRLVALATIIAATASPSLALTISPNFDSSVTSLPDADVVESAFVQAASNIDALFANPVTVNVNVSWGSVAGQALPSNALGSSVSSLYGYFNYSQIKSWLTASATSAADYSALASLPSRAPAGESRYVITAAQAKALGLVSPTAGIDGSVGFGGSTSNYTFSEAGGIAPGTYDFVSVAEHELTEVMGRISGLSSCSPSYATVEDLFRFSDTGVHSFGCDSSAYFSIDNGLTDLANYNYSDSGGDRGDWLSTPYTNDTADAFTYPGTAGVLSTLDQTVLDVIGWGSSDSGSGGLSFVSTIKGADATNVPEPASLALLAAGTLAAAGLRRRRLPQLASSCSTS